MKLYQPLFTREISVPITEYAGIEDVQEISTGIFTNEEEAKKYAKFICHKGWKFEIIELEIIA
jgi:hypothetical protein